SATASPPCSAALPTWRRSTAPAASARPACSKACATTATPGKLWEEAEMASDFIVLSHREPYQLVELPDGDTVLRRKTNGVFTTLDAVRRQRRGTWIAWREHEEERPVQPRIRVPAPDHEDAYTVRRIPLSPDEARRFYYDFTSTALWP